MSPPRRRRRPARPIEDSETLTQFGCLAEQPAFHTRPQAYSPFPRTVSLLRGRLKVKKAAGFVRRTGRPRVVDGEVVDGVRYTTAAKLRAAGFKVVATPFKKNPLHVSVESADVWNTDVIARFEACFAEN